MKFIIKIWNLLFGKKSPKTSMEEALDFKAPTLLQEYLLSDQEVEYKPSDELTEPLFKENPNLNDDKFKSTGVPYSDKETTTGTPISFETTTTCEPLNTKSVFENDEVPILTKVQYTKSEISVIDYINKFGSINKLIAKQQFGINRLDMVVLRLRKKGLKFNTEILELDYKVGEEKTKKVASYSLKL